MAHVNETAAAHTRDHAACDHHARHHAHDQDHSGLNTHNHVRIEDTSGPRLLITLALNLLIPVAQVIGGIHAHSMALISDAAHNFSDFTAVFIAYVANRMGKRGASVHNTFGYRRAEIMAAVFNVALLLGAAAFIVYEALQRLHHPEAVYGRLVVLIAGIGIVGNGFSAWLLHRDAGHNLNVRGAFLHMLGDLLTSVVVALNGIVLIYKPWYWLDPVLSLMIALFILKNCWSILKEATAILMNATPNGLDVRKIKKFLEHIPGVAGVHYLHAWNLCSSSVAFSCHVVVPDQKLSRIEALSEKIREQLLHHFAIDHPVLQFETVPCGQGDLFCGMSCAVPESRSQPPKTSGGSGPLLFKKPFPFLARLVLGAVFVVAGFEKILHPDAFAQVISNYQILPGPLVNLTAIVLPWLELVLGLLLICGWWLPGAVALTNMLLVAFFAALLFNVVRGLDVQCGCFGASSGGSPSTWWYLTRDAAFLLLGAYLFYHAVIANSLKPGVIDHSST